MNEILVLRVRFAVQDYHFFFSPYAYRPSAPASSGFLPLLGVFP
jgi:hypothetical protein